jgi:hypothetical protein
VDTLSPRSHCFSKPARSSANPSARRCITEAPSLSASSTVRRGSSTKPVGSLFFVREGPSAVQNLVTRKYQTLEFGKLVRIDRRVNQRFALGTRTEQNRMDFFTTICWQLRGASVSVIAQTS